MTKASIDSPPSRTLTAALRAGQLPVPVGVRTGRSANTAAAAFEADLLRLGFLLDDDARDRLLRLSSAQLTLFHAEVLPAAKALVGDAVHRHLFLQFPEINVDDHAYLSWRIWTWARSVRGQQGETVDPDLRLLEPCLHLIHVNALKDHGACPVCQVPIQTVEGQVFSPPEHLPQGALSPLRLLRGNPAELALTDLLLSRLQSTAPAAEHELAELRDAVRTLPLEALESHLSAYLTGERRVAVREVLAQVTGTLMAEEARRDLGVALLSSQLANASDILRACDVLGGGDGRLEDARGVGKTRAVATRTLQTSTFGTRMSTAFGRMTGSFNFDARSDHAQSAAPEQSKGETRRAITLPKLSRPLRRALLDLLERRPAVLLPEELARHARAWTLLAERLHPLEDRRRVNVCAAFTALRGGLKGVHAVDLSAAGVTVPAQAGYAVWNGTLTHRSATSDLEMALKRGDLSSAWALVANRPGVLARRIDHLARASTPEQLEAAAPAIQKALRALSLPLLLTLRGHLRSRTATSRAQRSVRVKSGKVKILPALPALDVAVSAPLLSAVQEALSVLPLADTSPLRTVSLIQLGQGLENLMVPLARRTASEGLELTPAGSRLPIDLESGMIPRLFVHWVEPASSRVDLDLSAAFYGADWTSLGVCNFGDLQGRGNRGVVLATHSGDLQSAPAPHGATEFIDLNLEACRNAGVRHVAITVHSYTDIPFEELPTCTAGIMLLSPEEARGGKGSPFRPERVVQALQLSGRENTRLALALDLQDRVMVHADLPLGGGRTIHHSSDSIVNTLRTMNDERALGLRPDLRELAVLQASRAGASVRVIVENQAYTVHREEGVDFTQVILALLDGMTGGHQGEALETLPHADLVVSVNPTTTGVGPLTWVISSSALRQQTGVPLPISWLLDA
ncbi:TerD family protein (plasmid) [Deinococcus sp. KNUC1210]|uniref:TerD family protein n=1 Tax=Deinococcus sp. KNUC1210 TaxID=2917691 RepID=UPI001EEFDFA3|nr:TerD family protein [Deinococcus sp. KNUC1210]ULH17677.1 TerD family protein [Deinococcus sp. KNUC1210]